MKAIITKISTIEFDLDNERDRIKRIFKRKNEEPYRDALLNVIDIFEKDGIAAADNAYDALPYNEIDEYPLQESMGKWWWQINDNDFMYESNVETIRRLEIIKH
jgi:hypothetical protein